MNDIREYLKGNEYGMQVGYYVCCEKRNVVVARLLAAQDLIVGVWRVMVCQWKGHKFEEELLSAESGHTAIHCCRCGYSHDFYMN